jgi:hypothetical protein
VSVPRFVAEQLGTHVVGKPGSALVSESPQGGVLRASNFRRDVSSRPRKPPGPYPTR